MDIDIPEVVAEVFARYEAALTTNDVPALDAAFWNDPRVVRFALHVHSGCTSAQDRGGMP